jgi:outer membrane protein TolC
MNILISLSLVAIASLLSTPAARGATPSALLPADTVVLSLSEAEDRARQDNGTVRAEFADARAAAQDAGEATRAFLPTIRAEVQGLRSTDPVAVFGLKLRQSAFAQEDFAMDALNNPSAYAGFMSSLTAELPILAPEGLFGHGAAKKAGEARQAQAERMAGATVLQLRMAYWDAQLAAERVTALRAAVQAAEGHVTQAEALRDQGMVTGLDARLAGLSASGLRVRLVAAEAEAENARARVAVLAGLPAGTALRLSDPLDAGSGTGEAEAVEDESQVGWLALDARGDLRALGAAVSAANSGRKRAWASQLPQVVAFGALSYHGDDTPWADGSGDWTVGVGVRWNLFSGLGGISAVRRANAQLEAAEARLEYARAQARSEVDAARRHVEAARRGAEIAAQAEAEAVTALEQSEERYRQGISPITELLDVEAARTDAALQHLSSLRDLYVAQAALAFAYGELDR